MIPSHKLGKNGISLPAIGYGAMGLNQDRFIKNPIRQEEEFDLLDAVFTNGVAMIDTTNAYGPSEDIIEANLKARPNTRSKLFVAKKFALSISPTLGMTVNSTPGYALEAMKKSLKRLGVDRVDLVYCHRVDGKTPIEHNITALKEPQKQGKTKHIGLSEVSATTLRRACAVHHIDAIQVEYSPFCTEVESPQVNLLATAKELGVAVVCYGPLSKGLATGQYKSHHDYAHGEVLKNFPRFNEDDFPKNLRLVNIFTALAEKPGCTPAQLSLACLLAQGEEIVVIPGTRKVHLVTIYAIVRSL